MLLAVVAVWFVSLAVPAVFAGEPVTLSGNIVCAKCTLKVAGLDKCQDVLLVKNDKAEETQYWLVANDVTKAFGDVCETVRPVTVTGTVEEKDGKHWIAPSKIDPRTQS
jgi:hypothetical protein